MPQPNKRFTDVETTGFGTQSTATGRRLYGKDGSPNLVKRGVSFFDGLSWYHSMITMARWKFWLWLLTAFILLNLFFASLYYIIGIDHLSGIAAQTESGKFAEAFFFSAQTLTTVGYGRINPLGIGASAIAAFESFIGLLSLALASGLFYGRFAKPRAFIKFSDNILISPYKNGSALMFRIVPYKKHHLIDVEVKLTAALRMMENGVERNKFYTLDVEFNKINALVLNWTIVHPLTEDSPLHRFSVNELKDFNLEIVVFLKGYDEAFSSNVVTRTSYTADEIVEGARFLPMYYSDQSNSATVLEVNKLNSYEKVTLPTTTPA